MQLPTNRKKADFIEGNTGNLASIALPTGCCGSASLPSIMGIAWACTVVYSDESVEFPRQGLIALQPEDLEVYR